MSDLFKSALAARISKLPAMPPSPTNSDSESEETDSLGALPAMGMGPPPAALPRKTRKIPAPPNPAYAPLSASNYFTSASQVAVPSRSLDVRVYYTPPKFADGTVMVCHHGAGYSGLSFACFAKEVGDLSGGEVGVLSFDARRHGKTTKMEGTDDSDLSIEVLTADLVELLKVVFPDSKTAPTFLFVGHSMGGSVVVHAIPLLQTAKYKVTGIAVIDVVEGTALEALPHMLTLLTTRPTSFPSPNAAIEWHLRTNTIQNPTSARISIPSILRPSTPLEREEGEQDWVWTAPLRSTKDYWAGWFKGLSGMFLGARCARLLVLAGAERLDKELMIGQMMGKFQLEVVGNVGHLVHEDDPTRTAELLVEFWRRNERVLVGVKKVGEL
ncbi:Alpha/Beta hydrolase protein [Cyathus striatus]|nr:Alpha/Beta hydrolase protein [Cyathus striatus]